MYQIGVDIGGTTIKFGLVDDRWNIVGRMVIPFPHEDGQTVANKIAETVHVLLQEQAVTRDQLRYIGIVVPGSIDPTKSVVIDAHNLGFHDVPFRSQLQQAFNDLDVYLANDADGAALAELGRGAFIGTKTAVLLTLGTGVGGGVIIGGKLFSGGCGRGIEVGHMQLSIHGEPCTCGNYGCVESHCSATAMIRDGLRAAEAHPESKLNLIPAEELNARYICECAKDGDPAAKEVFDNFVDHLGSACVSIVHLLDPEVIAIGGGVSHAGDQLFVPLRENVLKKCFFDSCGEIVPAVMGNDAGIVGAAMLGANQ